MSYLPDEFTGLHGRFTAMRCEVAGETKCLWCNNRFTPRRGGSPQRFCSAEHRSLFWSALRRWAERTLAAGVLTIADIRGGTACTLPGAAISPPPPSAAPAEAEEGLSDEFGRLFNLILAEPTIVTLIVLGWLARDRQEDLVAIVHAFHRFVGHVLEMDTLREEVAARTRCARR
jgi:hypothetical protein